LNSQIRWFKNWASLKSVKAIEHFHVMIYKPDMKLIDELTEYDIPLHEKTEEKKKPLKD
jgi:hypothetical protein